MCYLSRLMPKSIARSKTRKAVAKRFKITATGKVLRAQSSRRHLMGLKRAKRKRQLAKMLVLDKTDEARVKANLPFGYNCSGRVADRRSRAAVVARRGAGD